MSTLRDRNIAWLRKSLFLPVQTAAVTVITGATGVAASIETEASTAVLLTTIPGSGGNATAFTGFKINATTGVGVNWNIVGPWDLDISKNLGFSVLYTHRTTGVTALTTVTWQVLVNQIKFPQIGGGTAAARTGGGFLSTTAAPAGQPATALDVAIVADTAVSGNTDNVPTIYISPRGFMKGSGALTTGASANQLAFWQIRALASATTATHTDDLYMLGLVLDYDQHKTFGPGKPLSGNIGTPLLQNLYDQGYSPVFNLP